MMIVRCVLSVITVCLFVVSCHPRTLTDSYHEQYCYLQDLRDSKDQEVPFSESSQYYFVICVDAKHLDYTDAQTLLDTIAKHPDGSGNRYVGHAWIVLCGEKEGKRVLIEGGHSGELGVVQPKYLEGVMLLASGESSSAEWTNYAKDPNPIRYLHTTLKDGFFQKGPGIHIPTYVVRFELNKEQFEAMYAAIHPEVYDYTQYSLTANQCTTFVVKVASLAGITLDHEVEVQVPAIAQIDNVPIRLWEDARYEKIVISSPDILEKSLVRCVQTGKGKPALRWYTNVYPRLIGTQLIMQE